MLLRFEVPAPGLCGRAPVRRDLVRATPFGVEETDGVGEARGDIDVESGGALRPGVEPSEGFFVAVDILNGRVEANRYIEQEMFVCKM